MILRESYYKPNEKTCENLSSYLTSIAGNKLKDISKRQNIFKTEWKRKEVELINRCHIQSAVDYLSFLNSQKFDNKVIDNIKITIAEIARYVQVVDTDQDTSFIFSSNSLPSTIHYKHAESLFYENRMPKDARKRYSIDILVLYALRLSLEKRILGFLGIDYIVGKNGSPIMMSRLFPIIKSLNNIEFDSNIDFDQVKWVWDWLNHYMHRHLRPEPWTIHQAFIVLNPLLLPTISKTTSSLSMHFYGSTRTSDWPELKEEIVELIESNFGEVKINWRKNLELKME